VSPLVTVLLEASTASRFDVCRRRLDITALDEFRVLQKSVQADRHAGDRLTTSDPGGAL